ncbi:Sph1p [Saccharomyces eubayanus]|uniref:Sph1p n=1 Tax=Saccharomyces eubayanus TaxID=1080349 RepID=UPI0006C47365|nr:SPH1-like protein [Saccharomyces eubayanus]KOG97995.1 SPH1-like protein [Saccharomyces eubayanus]
MTSSELTNDQIIDLITDYKNFKRIIETSVSKDNRRRNSCGGNNNNLSKLSDTQFWQLATDVNNELMKRLTNSNVDEDDHGLKRGKAQSKLSRLNDSKFDNLIYDIFTEIEERKLHDLNKMSHFDTMGKGEFNFYFNDSLFESININDNCISASGIVPMEAFRELRSQFVLYFQNTLHQVHPTDATAPLPILLETVFNIASLINEVLPLLLSPSLPEPLEKEIVYLKSALSHTITSTRYYLTFGDLVPRIVIQSSISELIFAFCNIVQIVKIKPTSPPHVALPSEKKLDDGETAMKPLKIIEKLKNEEVGKEALGKGASDLDGSSSPGKVSTVEPGNSMDESKINTPQPISSISKTDVVVNGKSHQINEADDSSPCNRKIDSKLVLNLNNPKNPSTVKNKLSSRDDLNVSSPLDKVLPSIGQSRQHHRLSPPNSHIINKSPAETTKHKEILSFSDVPESPTAARMRRFKEKLQHFGSSSGLGFRISTSDEDVKNSEVKKSTPKISTGELLEFVEGKTTIVVPMVQGILSGIQDSKSKNFEGARPISALCQDSVKLTPILKTMIDMTTEVMTQQNSKSYLNKHANWIVKGLTDCSKRLTSLCSGGHTLLKVSDKHFYQKLAGILFDVVKCAKELVKCVEKASGRVAL